MGNLLAAKVILPNGRPYQDNFTLLGSGERDNLLLLRHPNVTFLYNAFEHRGLPYLIMERCSFTLRDLVDSPVNTAGFVLHVARTCCKDWITFTNSDTRTKICMRGMYSWPKRRTGLTQPSARFGTCKIGDVGISKLANALDHMTSWLNGCYRPNI